MTQHIHFKRDIVYTLTKRVSQDGCLIQVLLGPRQIGKTTAILQAIEPLRYPKHYASADLPAPPDSEWIVDQWAIARKMCGQEAGLLVLDEIQKIPRWSEVVKALWDEEKRIGSKLRVVLLGSSAFMVQRGLTESLAGRFELIRALHWSYEECRQCFKWDLQQYLFFGGYPGSAALISDERRWMEYVRDSLIESAISKDVLLVHPIEKPALLRKLFMLACEYSGQILSYQKIQGQLKDAGNVTTLANYQRYLEAAFLIVGLEKFSGSRVKRRSSSPKWLPLNAALVTSIWNLPSKKVLESPEIYGRLVETAVGAHLFQYALKNSGTLYYWRERNDEVDYVLQLGRKVFAIEVKSGLQKRFAAGIRQFEKKYNVEKSFTVGGQDCPLEEFLSSNLDVYFRSDGKDARG